MMTRDQAEEIQRHLLAAARAMDRASAAIAALGEEARSRFAKPLGTVVCDLHFELLRMIHQAFPDLEPPPREIPTISSTLRWEDVTLPASVSEADIDRIIFAELRPLSRKVAFIIGKATSRCAELGLPVTGEMIGARLIALAEAGEIEGLGDLRKWRHSEVQLKP
jgi:hypothetical protein